MEPASFLGLPAELHGRVIDNLSFPDNVSLKATCRYFRDLVVFGHAEQLKAESTPYAISRDLYACSGCSRLRHSRKFADNMLKRRRRRNGPGAHGRFCVECGTTPREGTCSTRYTPGAHIQLRGAHHVICLDCRRFSEGAMDAEGTARSFCPACWERREGFREGIARRQEEHERRRLREEQVRRREARRAVWGSEYENSDDGPEPSPTPSELYMDMVQAEADAYMNSPSAGSE